MINDFNGFVNLVSAMVAQAEEDANKCLPTVVFKPDDERSNKKAMKKIEKTVALKKEASEWLKNLRANYGN